ncbi:flavin monoamine oxidase family protein, partial [Chloroflexota bacterium]
MAALGLGAATAGTLFSLLACDRKEMSVPASKSPISPAPKPSLTPALPIPPVPLSGGTYPQTIIVIGAGIAGLSSASALHGFGHQVTVLEGRKRIGGRSWTYRSLDNIPLDLGASWIHGFMGNPITGLSLFKGMRYKVTDYGSKVLYNTEGRLISKGEETTIEERFFRILTESISKACSSKENGVSLQEAINSNVEFNNLSSSELLQFNYSLNTWFEHDASGSARALSACHYADGSRFAGDDVILLDGYAPILEEMAQGLNIQLEQVVESVDYSKDQTEVRTNQGSFIADKVIVTLPLGVLKKGTVKFIPELPKKKQTAIEKLGMGVLNKLYLRFPYVFWDREVDWIGYIPQDHGEWAEWLNISKYINQPILLGFNAADYGKRIENLTDKSIVSIGMEVLRKIYGSIPTPESVLITRWASDPFAYGSYSFIAAGATGEDYDTLAEPVSGKLYFAGEATSQYGSTVHGAYISGQREANRIE